MQYINTYICIYIYIYINLLYTYVYVIGIRRVDMPKNNVSDDMPKVCSCPHAKPCCLRRHAKRLFLSTCQTWLSPLTCQNDASTCQNDSLRCQKTSREGRNSK